MINSLNSIVDFQPYYNETDFSHISYSLRKEVKRYYDPWILLRSRKVEVPYAKSMRPPYTEIHHRWKCLFTGHTALLFGCIRELDFWTKGEASVRGPCDRCGHQVKISLTTHNEVYDCISLESKIQIVIERNQLARRQYQDRVIQQRIRKAAEYRQFARQRKEYKLADFYRTIIEKDGYTIEEAKDGSYQLKTLDSFRSVKLLNEYNIIVITDTSKKSDKKRKGRN